MNQEAGEDKIAEAITHFLRVLPASTTGMMSRQHSRCRTGIISPSWLSTDIIPRPVTCGKPMERVQASRSL
jgi:hypothetical protein